MRKEYNSELPPGFEKAWDKYYPNFEKDSIEDIWESLRNLKDFKEGLPRLRSLCSGNGELLQRILPHHLALARQLVAQFQARVWKAVEEEDRPYIQRLLRALEMPNRPEPLMNGIRAAMLSFFHASSDVRPRRKRHWPTKKEVRRGAEEILKQAGLPLPTDRQWPRIYHKAGLSALPKATRRDNPKVRARHGTNGHYKRR